MKAKKLYLVLVVLVIAVLIGGAIFYVGKQQVKPETVFRNYIIKGLQTTTIAQEQELEGTGSSAKAAGLLDTKAKKFIIKADITCRPSYDNKELTIKATIQQENTKGYVRVNSLSGRYTNSAGTKYDLQKVFSKVVGTWYQFPEQDKPMDAQLDSGIFVFSSVLLAPGYDVNKIADSLIAHNAFTFTNFKKDGKNFTFDITGNRAAYRKVLEEHLSNLSNIDLILDGVFDEKDSVTSTVTIDKDSNFISETLTDTNLCYDLVNNLIGEEPLDIPKQVRGTSKSVTASQINIENVEKSKPLEGLSKDMVL